MKMRGLFLTAATFAVTTAVITNAWIQKKQFYPTVVYLTKSSGCMAVLYGQAFVFVLLLGKLMRKLFFGQLRPAETEHLIERSWYAVTDTCLAFTLFRDDFSPLFVASFTLLLFLRCFHWLLEDRVDFMEQIPVITLLFKIRVLSLLAILFACDILFVFASYQVTFTKGASVQLVFGFEYAILATIVMTVFLKYLLHLIDLQSDNPWENKTAYMLYAEVVTGLMRVVLYICFTVFMTKVHTFPLFSVRPMYLTMRQFKKSLSDIILSRTAIRNMSTLYPDATAEELLNTDQTCIICREDMQANTEPQPGVEVGVNKKLPCGHIFHSSCLRSWFQRQQTCPTCRLDVLQTRQPPSPPEQERPPDGAVAAQQQQQQPNIPPPPYGNMFPPPPNMFPPPPNMFPGAPPSQPSTSTSPQGSAPPPTGAFPGAFPPMMPSFMPPPPIPPPDLNLLSEDQLRRMESSERRGVEARIECLRNISLLLDAAVNHVQHYCTAVQSQGGQSFQIPAFPNLNTPPPQHSGSDNLPQTAASSSDLPQTAASSSDLPQTTAETFPQLTTTSQIVEELTLPRESTPLNNENDVSSSDEGVSEPNASELRRRRLAKLQPQTTADDKQ